MEIELLRRLRIPRELIDLGIMATTFIGLGVLGRLMFSPERYVDTFGVFALAGIAGACWGYWRGSAPIRKLRLECDEYVRKPRTLMAVRELPRGYGDMRGGSRGTGPRW